MRAAAFFDVDETLISVKSMFDFLRYHLEDDQTPEHGQAHRWAELQRLIAAGTAPRAEINRDYYRIYRGVPVDLLQKQGARWFAARRRDPGFFQPAVIRELIRHRRSDDAVVLISGSFSACLEPLGAAVGASHLLCSQQLIDSDGRLTGEIEQPMIGPAKAVAVREFATSQGIALNLSFGYGDHSSDLPLLLEVGHPAVVGADPTLDSYAQRYNWRRLALA